MPKTAATPAHRARRRWLPAACAMCLCSALSQAQEAPALAPFSAATGAQPPASWHFSTLPQKVPTRFEITALDGQRVLKVEADQSYGNLVHRARQPLNGSTTLSWRWRVDQFIQGVDLHARAGDDGIAKLCVFFDFPAARLPVIERTQLALARTLSGEDIPGETLCYVWDAREPKGSLLNNAFTDRMRMIVLESGPASAPGGWLGERRNLLADYRRAFGAEAGSLLPDVIAVAISADADNTHGRGLAYFGDVALQGRASQNPLPATAE